MEVTGGATGKGLSARTVIQATICKKHQMENNYSLDGCGVDNLGGYVASVARIYKVLPGLAPHCTGSSYVPTQQGALWSVKQRQEKNGLLKGGR